MVTKKITLSLLLLTFIALLPARATIVNPYDFDFNDSIATDDPAFKVSTGWSHLVASEYAPDYVSYEYKATDGVDGTGALYAGRQALSDGWDTYDVNDLLVTPAITGNMSIMVKKDYSSSSIKFYKMTYENGKWVMGDQIDADVSGLSTSEYATVNISGLSNEYVGIRADRVYLDNFAADEADIVMVSELSFSNITKQMSSTGDCDTTNHYTVGYTVQVKNTGDNPINGYDLYIIMSETADGDAVDTVAVKHFEDTLAVGETSAELEISGKVDASTYPERMYFRVAESVSQKSQSSSSYGDYVTPVPYKPVLAVTDVNDKYTVYTSGQEINFGTSNTEVTKSFNITNNGGAPLHVTELTITGGFKVSLTAPFDVSPHESQQLDVTMPVSTTGNLAGTLTLKGDDIDDFTLSFKGFVIDSTKWYVNFEDEAIPENVVTRGGQWSFSSSPRSLGYASNVYCAQTEDESTDTWLISPKLKFTDNEEFRFDAARRGSYEDAESTIDVYWSPDRNTWTLLRSLSSSKTDEDSISNQYKGYKYGTYTDYYFTTYILNLNAGEGYIGFKVRNARLDNLLGGEVEEQAHDVAYISISTPDKVMVNHKGQISVIVKNLGDENESADSYTVSLHLGDETFSGDAPELVKGQNDTLAIEFTPHRADTLKAWVEGIADSYKWVTDTVDVIVSEESASTIQKVDSVTSLSGSKTPIYSYYSNSESQVIYTADSLKLSTGAKITGITYKGYSTKELPTQLTICLMNTDKSSFTDDNDSVPVKDMTLVFKGSYTIPLDGTESNAKDMISVTFDEPFVYEGKNLLVYVKNESGSYNRTYFEIDGNIQDCAIYRANDYNLAGAYQKDNVPVMYLSIEKLPTTIEGVVTDEKGTPLDSALVTVKSNDVEYKAMTDENGHYLLTIYQSDLDYNMSVTLDKYNDYNAALASATENQTINIKLTSIIPDNISETEIDKHDVPAGIYNLQGQKLSHTVPGINIIVDQNGKSRKVIVEK